MSIVIDDIPPSIRRGATDEEVISNFKNDMGLTEELTALDLNDLLTDNIVEEESTDGVLMCKDVEVARINHGNVTVFKAGLLPIGIRMKGSIRYDTVFTWLAKRVLPLDRANAKKVLNLLQLPQQDNLTVAIKCKALSLTDSYWYRLENDDSKWEDVNLYKNSFSEIISEIAFTGGSHPTIQGEYKTPELTGQGSYRKCWVRDRENIYLYKGNTKGGKESEAEYIISLMLDLMKVDHVKYDLVSYRGSIACKCGLITDEDTAIIPFVEFNSFLLKAGRNSLDFISKTWFKDYYTMLLVDGIVHNVDRHGYNWGLLMDSNNGKVLGLHPLFDHNCGIYIEGGEEYSHMIPNKTLLEVGKYAYTKLGKPDNVRNLLDWIERKDTKILFNDVFKDKDFRRQFLIKRIKYILE